MVTRLRTRMLVLLVVLTSVAGCGGSPSPREDQVRATTAPQASSIRAPTTGVTPPVVATSAILPTVPPAVRVPPLLPSPTIPLQPTVTQPSVAPASTAMTPLPTEAVSPLQLRSLEPLLFAAQDARITDIAIAVGGSEPLALFVATTDGVYLSHNQGTKWMHHALGWIDSLAISPNYAHDQTIFAAGHTQAATETHTLVPRVYQSADGGRTWTDSDLEELHGVDSLRAQLAISPTYADDQTLVVYTYAGNPEFQTGQIFRSTNGGRTWMLEGFCPLREMALSSTYHQDHTLLAECEGIAGHSASGNGIYRSTDGGNSWERVAQRTPSLVLALEDPDFLNKEAIAAGWPPADRRRVTIIRSPDYTRDRLIFGMIRAGKTAQMVVSYDQGQNWTPVITDLGFPGDDYPLVATFAVAKDDTHSYRMIVCYEQQLWVAHIAA